MGLKLISKYSKDKNIVYVYVGLTWIGLSTLWLASSISFLYDLITTKKIPEILYFLIGVTLIPWFILIWIMAFSILTAEKLKKPHF